MTLNHLHSYRWEEKTPCAALSIYTATTETFLDVTCLLWFWCRCCVIWAVLLEGGPCSWVVSPLVLSFSPRQAGQCADSGPLTVRSSLCWVSLWACLLFLKSLCPVVPHVSLLHAGGLRTYNGQQASPHNITVQRHTGVSFQLKQWMSQYGVLHTDWPHHTSQRFFQILVFFSAIWTWKYWSH